MDRQVSAAWGEHAAADRHRGHLRGVSTVTRALFYSGGIEEFDVLLETAPQGSRRLVVFTKDWLSKMNELFFMLFLLLKPNFDPNPQSRFLDLI